MNFPTDRLRDIIVGRDDRVIQNAVSQLLEANVVSRGMFKRVFASQDTRWGPILRKPSGST